MSDLEVAAGDTSDDEVSGMLRAPAPAAPAAELPKYGRGGPAAAPAHIQTNEWYHTSSLLLADIIGTGILSLPGAFAKLGFAGGSVLLLISYALNLYTGVLLARLKLWFPAARSYGVLMGEAFGPRGKVYGYAVLTTYIFGILGNYQIVVARSLQGMLWDRDLCRPTAGLVGALLMLPGCQLRTLKSVSYLSVISFLTIVIVVAICAEEVVEEGVLKGSERVAWNPDLEYAQGFTAISSYIFAFSGQKIYLELMAEMREPAHFRRSLYALRLYWPAAVP